mmetsp:Transcript_32013/g.39729  ORF Transcript_32013/g.39729 Transcript_32013/m.39729 type:complete len:84 (-) Transcript_32013:123-374(-)|eukprot:CAMPEP_0170457056 /NCGR_PEP_ID=MMETSP0123-20130129/4477_1 /TAXON_ID=182087 /ORGANISM="Favella ehrenbergii, Strain Fehren 1" /LENGTH=83 /DNA_ID=CAMNT_0010720725 /DNA_START=1582 /DNA_END=1833 /DNA_ORIENTATION=+
MPQESDPLQKYFSEKLAAASGDKQKEEEKKSGKDSDDKDKANEHDLTDLLDMKMGSQLTMKEREKIYIAAELIQKNYLELRKE